MTVRELRERFCQYMLARDHVAMEEVSLVNPVEDTFFTMAAAKVAAPFLREQETPPRSNLFTTQRMFSANQLEFCGRYPVATPLEVQMSSFRLSDTSPITALHETLGFLEQELGFERRHLYFLAPDEYGIYSALDELQFPRDNLITWKKTLAYKMGEQGPFGHYGRFFLHYRHGLFPVVDLTFMRSHTSERLLIESCAYLDRLLFAWQGARTWFETPLYLSLVDASSARCQGNRELAYATAVLTRALVALLGDGLDITPKGPGYVGRKIVRQIVTSWWTQVGAYPQLHELVPPALSCLAWWGYDFSHKAGDIAAVLEEEERLAKETLESAESFVAAQAKRQRVPTDLAMSHLLQWKDSRGIPETVALRVLEQTGLDTSAIRAELNKPEPFYLKMAGYPFADDDPIDRPADWLRAAEDRRYAIRK